MINSLQIGDCNLIALFYNNVKFVITHRCDFTFIEVVVSP